MNLTELSIKYGTDKQPQDHNYMPIYEFWLKDRNIESMLEVGFGAGASMKMWLEYYNKSNVYCIEYMDNEHEQVWNRPDLNLKNLNLFVGDSTIPATWNQIPFDLDFIVDDGSHYPEDQLKTFMLGFSHVKKGGLYFIEDTHCGGEKKYGASMLVYDWVREIMINQQAFHVQTGGDFYKARHYMDSLTADIYSIHSYKSIIIIEKAL